jgi:hypothetical protein
MRARLTSSIFLNPKTPLALGEQSEFQDLRERFLTFLGAKPPPEILKHLIKLFAEAFREKKSTHSI